MSAPASPPAPGRIAIVGMAGRFPGAADVEALWAVTERGAVALRRVDDERPGIVPVRGVLDGADRFDADYFGVGEREAELLDAQQRVLLEVSQHALDDAGIDPARPPGPVAVYATTGPSEPAAVGSSYADAYERELAASPDFAATRVSYRLGLRGESVTVHTGCSSSLVAVHLACQSLLAGQADAALAVAASFPADQARGYPAEDGMITSPSGRCRPFDAAADGAVPGGGAAAVVLRRLDAALADGDRIRAVVAGSAANNDGRAKSAFTAPSPSGQAEVIAAAHALAGVPARKIGYVETHGTATALGDAIEIEGLRRAFALDARRAEPCALGSLKANCGHMDRAAGIAGLVRAALVVERGVIPPMAGFESPNPELGLDAAGLVVPRAATAWRTGAAPRRAGVSAFGVGGTNVHLVLEQAPERAAASDTAPADVLLPLAGTSHAGLGAAAAALANRLESHSETDLRGSARTLACGRPRSRWRGVVVARDARHAAPALRSVAAVETGTPPTVVLAFPGAGDATVDGMREVYDAEPAFRVALDDCANSIAARDGPDVRHDLYADMEPNERAELYGDMARFQASLFAVEWALAALWRSWGVEVGATLGHSIGEVAAAACAGILDLDGAAALALERGRLLQASAPGSVLSVALPEADLRARLEPDTTIAAVNGRELTAAAGPPEAVARLERRLVRDGISVRRLAIRRAPHVPALDGAARRLREFAASLAFGRARTPLLANVSGDWAGDAMSCADYWATQLRSPVRFGDALERVAELPRPLVLVAGPGRSFGQLVAHELAGRAVDVVASAPGGSRRELLDALGRLWVAGAACDPAAPLGPELPAKGWAPATQFDHSRRWPVARRGAPTAPAGPPARHADPAAWLYEPAREAGSGATRSEPARPALIGRSPLARAVGHELGRAGEELPAVEHVDRASALPDGVTDVLWWVADSGPDALPAAARLGRALQRRSPQPRVWALAPAIDGDGSLPAQALARAIARVAPQELPRVAYHAVELAGRDPRRLARGLSELIALRAPAAVLAVGEDGGTSLAYRRAWPDWRARPLRAGGCYVITGGLGRVGRALAVAHGAEVAAHLVLIGRRPAAAVAERLGSVRAKLRERGSTCEYVAVDVADRAALARCLASLRRRFGRVDGVVHAAGFTDRSAFRLLEDSDAATLELVAGAKVAGARNLAAVLGDDADYVLLCSSVSTVLGGVGFGAYVAANAALDALARERHRRGDRRWVSVGWDAWSSDGDAPTLGAARYALDDADGREVFRRALSARAPELIVSTAELADRAREVHEQLAGAAPVAPAAREERPEPVVAAESAIRAVLGQLPDDRQRDLRERGVESLQILQIVTRLREALGAEIALADAMRDLSVDGLAALAVDGDGAAGRGPSAFALERAPAADRYPTSSAQRRWLELLPDGYGGIDIAIEVRGTIAARELAAALRRVVDRHSGLRTRFEPRPRGWAQLLEPTGDVPVVDLGALPSAAQSRELERLAHERAVRWFDVADRPPFEVTVARLAPDRHALLLHAHHVVFDGWSSSLFLRDLDLAARGALGDEPPLQYVDYAVAQSAYLESDELARSREHWRRHFAGAPTPTRIAPDRDGDRAPDRGAVLRFGLDAGATAAIGDLAGARRTTPFALMTAAYALLLHELTGKADLVLGTAAAGRPSAQAEEIVGVFVNPLPVRITVRPDEALGDLVERVHGLLVDFHEHGHYPLEDLVAHVEPFVGLGLNDTFHCYLLYQNYWRHDGLELGFSPLVLARPPRHKLMRELEIVLEERDGVLKAELWFLESRFSPARARGWARRYRELLELLAVRDVLDTPVSTLLTPRVTDVAAA